MAIPFRRILVPIDFTDVSSSALDWAIELAGSLGASVTVMHTYVIPVVGFPDGALIPSAERAIGLRDAAGKGLGAGGGILRRADEIHADVIVIGTHGRHGLARALLGSVAEHVARTAHRPVIT